MVININTYCIRVDNLQELEEQLNFKIEQAAVAAHIDNIF